MAQKIFKINQKLKADAILEKRDVYSSILKEVFLESQESGTSDIHFEPFTQSLLVRMRVSGQLKIIKEICDLHLLPGLIVRLKEIIGFDISTDSKAQDRAFSLFLTVSRYRASLVPSVFGESIVLRVIKDNALPKLHELGLSEKTLSYFRKAMCHKQGMIIITGPTGSGKSSTLQAMLLEIDRKETKVLTLEDPVERHIDNVIQQQITEHLTWKAGIKAALRQDPDVILIGEIRDSESALLAFEAAQTGHLVLTTLHANDVSSLIDRLLTLEVPKHLVNENLVLATAQRLVSLLCESCKETQGEGFFQKGQGCDNCLGLGVKGRQPIIEFCYKPKLIGEFQKEDFKHRELKTSLEKEKEKLVKSGRMDDTSFLL